LLDSVEVSADGQPVKTDDLKIIEPRRPGPNIWSVLQKWILALPTGTEAQRQRRRSLQIELERVVREFDNDNGLGKDGVCPSLPSRERRILTNI
jgi:ethanolamine kinase